VRLILAWPDAILDVRDPRRDVGEVAAFDRDDTRAGQPRRRRPVSTIRPPERIQRPGVVS
jgi:hypothetical protein